MSVLSRLEFFRDSVNQGSICNKENFYIQSLTFSRTTTYLSKKQK